MATDTLKRLSGPTQLTTSAVTQYTVPGGTTTALRNVHVCNTTSSAAAFYLSIGAMAAGTELWDKQSIPAHGSFDWTGNVVLAAAETLQAKADTATALTMTISGVETA